MTGTVTVDRPVIDIRRRVAGLDGVRAVAAYGVIATHVGFQSGLAMRNGFRGGLLARLDFGVTLFFLVSGFVIFRPFAQALLCDRSLPGPLGFWWRRALRILPAYWVVVMLTLGLLSGSKASAGERASYLLLIQTFDHNNLDPSLSQMWTLSTELSFYLILPLLALAIRRWTFGRTHQQKVRLMLVLPALLALVALIWRLATSVDASLWFQGLLWLPTQLDWFALGMLLAVLSLLPGERIVAGFARWARDTWTCVGVGMLFYLLATLPLAGPRSLLPPTVFQAETKHYLYGAAAFFLLLPVVLDADTVLHRALSARLPSWLGEISYGVYLWHLPMLILIQSRWLNYPLFSGHFLILYGLTAGAATMLAAASYYLLERPLLRRFSHRTLPGRPRGNSPASATTQSN